MNRTPDDTIVVKPQKRDSFYRSIELQVYNYETTVADENGESRTFEFRLLTPHKVNDKHYFKKDLIFRMEKLAKKGKKEQREFYSWALSMIEFFTLCQEGMFRRDRKFFLRTMHEKEPFKELSKIVEKQDSDGVEIIEKLAETDWGIEILMEDAIFKNINPVTSLWDEGYRAFCDIILENIEEARNYIESLKGELLDQAREIFETSGEVNESKRAELLALVDRAKMGNPKEMRGVTFNALRRIIVDAYLLEIDASEDTSPIAEKAYEIINEGVKGIDLSGSTEEVEKALAERFREAEFNGVIHKMMRWFEENRGITPVRIENESEAEEILKHVKTIDPDAEHIPEFYQYLSLFEALFAKNIKDKYAMLGWISEKFLSKTYYMDRLYRDGERVYLNILEPGYKQVYNDIKHVLTREEKRAYKLAHFPQPYFNGRIAIEEPRILEFAHMDHEDTKNRWILGLVFGIDKFGPYEKNEETLEKRWKAYLRFYPTWVSLVRGAERDEKREKKHRTSTISTSRVLRRKDDEGREILLEDVLRGPRRFEPDKIISKLLREPQNPELQRWVADYCTPAQKRTIETMFLQGFFLDLEKTATSLDLDEKTVYDHIRDGRDRIAAGLIGDALFPKSKFPKKKPRLDLK